MGMTVFGAPISGIVISAVASSFPRNRESTDVGPCFRGADKGHSLWWAKGPWKLTCQSDSYFAADALRAASVTA